MKRAHTCTHFCHHHFIFSSSLWQKEPPKGKLFSSLKGACDPNNDKTVLFTSDRENASDIPSSAVRNHIQQIDSALRQRNCKSKVRKMPTTDANETERRLQRMIFMGIPTERRDKSKIQFIVSEISRNSALTHKSTSKDNHLNAKIAPRGVKLMPAIPARVEWQQDVAAETEDECEQSKIAPPFVNAKPRGSDPEMLRTDKSLPWIQHDVDATRANLESSRAKCNAMADYEKEDGAHVRRDKEKIADANRSEMKRCYDGIIAMKLRSHGDIDNSENELQNDESEAGMQSMQSASSFSSTGTNFTNDSGSYIVVLNEKIPKSRLNIGKKFQVGEGIECKSHV
jgi:hypothetical protein